MDGMSYPATRSPGRSVKWLVLALVAIGTFMSTLDASIMTVAMPTLTNAFHTTVATSQWFVLSYTFVVTVFLLTFGKLGDLFGRRKLYASGVVVFSIGSLACGVSVSSLMLILARALQGLGSAAVMSCGTALVTDAFPPQERGRGLGLIGTAVALGLLAGPLMGGMIIQYASWRWMFFINLPIGLVLSLLITMRVHGYDENRGGRLDIRGAVLMGLALASLLSALTFGGSFGWESAPTILLFVLSAVFTAAFIAAERVADTPVLRLRLFREREFSIGTVAGWANYAGTMPIAVFIPFYLENTLNYTPHMVGLMLTFGPMTLTVVAPIVGNLSDRIGPRFLTATGLLVGGIGLAALSRIGPHQSFADVAWRLVLASLGSAIFVSPNSSAVMGSVPRHDLGVAAGVVALVRNLGMVCGVAIGGAVILSVQRGFHGPHDLGFLAGLKTAFLVFAACLFAAAAMSSTRARSGEMIDRPA